jgi:hypothetical protein
VAGIHGVECGADFSGQLDEEVDRQEATAIVTDRNGAVAMQNPSGSTIMAQAPSGSAR